MLDCLSEVGAVDALGLQEKILWAETQQARTELDVGWGWHRYAPY